MKNRWWVLCMWCCAFGVHGTLVEDVVQIPVEVTDLYQRTHQLSIVDATRGLLIGQSFGGATSVALAAKNIDGVKGAVNFAGGSGGNPTGRPENPCSEPLLAQTYAGYGKTAKTPMLWLYSENDRYWGKEHPRGWFEGFKKQGGDGQFVQLPPNGRDGHSSFAANPGAWKPHVESFLKSLGFPD